MVMSLCATVPKDSGNPQWNEDAFREDLAMGVVALCDGASESYDSRRWAELLAEGFLRNRTVNHEWLQEVIAEYCALNPLDTLSWSQVASYERGSYATLLGIEYNFPTQVVKIHAVGDTLAVLLEDGEFIESFPQVHAAEFGERPTLLSTVAGPDDTAAEALVKSISKKEWTIERPGSTQLLCMTDALAEWALRHHEMGTPKWKSLLNIEQDDFNALVHASRSSTDMRTDDTTLVSLSFKE
jgi:hypothetical protein